MKMHVVPPQVGFSGRNSLHSRLLQVVGARKNSARGRHASLPLARPFFLAYYFQRLLGRLGRKAIIFTNHQVSLRVLHKEHSLVLSIQRKSRKFEFGFDFEFKFELDFK